jgi:excisionase family DNA binding protein
VNIGPLNLSTLTCFHCNWETAKHKCKLRISDDVFTTVCLCDNCVKLDETELCKKFAGTRSKTVKQAAIILNVNEARVRQFIYSGRLFAEKVGRDLLIKSDDLEAFAQIERKPGVSISQKKNV